MENSKKPNTIIIVLSIIIGSIIIGGSIIYTNNPGIINTADINNDVIGTDESDTTTNETSKTILKDGEEFIIQEDKPITLTVISDEDCEACDTEKILSILKKQLGGSLAVRTIDYSSSEGADLLDKYNGTYIPFLLLGKEVAEHASITHLKHHFITKVDDLYIADLEKMGMEVGMYLDVNYYEKDDPDAPKIVINETTYDFGEVKLSEGKVQTEIVIKNDGGTPLTFLGLNTSCGCTSAKVVTPNGESPVYLMAGHGEVINWRGELAAGEEGKIVVYYDPTVHPDLDGDVTREVFVRTNDPNNTETSLKINVTQIPN